MADAECPECAGTITLKAGTETWEIVVCADCSSRLEVKSVAPASVAAAPKIEEDWGE